MQANIFYVHTVSILLLWKKGSLVKELRISTLCSVINKGLPPRYSFTVRVL